MNSEKHLLSVVVPLLNEEENIGNLHQEILKVLKPSGFKFEIIYVDDGSVDGTEKVLRGLSDCSVISMRRSFGQTASLMAGFDHSSGDIIITLDGDGQNDPSDILRMVEIILQSEIDFVIGWRKNRNDSLNKKVPSFFAYLLRQILLHDGIHDAGCGIKVFRREILSEIELFGEMHRFFASIAKSKGYKVVEVEVNHLPRIRGKSKYTWKRGAKGFLDMLAVWFWGKYAARPLHVLGGIGLVIIGCSLVALSLAMGHWFRDYGLLDTQRWFTFSILMFVLGIQLLVSGLVADIAVKGYFAAGKRKTYIVKSVQDMHHSTSGNR